MLCFFNDTATTEIYTLSLHDALPIWAGAEPVCHVFAVSTSSHQVCSPGSGSTSAASAAGTKKSVTVTAARSHPYCHEQARRSEEHTSELQSRQYLVCRLLLEKKNNCD